MTTQIVHLTGPEYSALCERQKRGEIRIEQVHVSKEYGKAWTVYFRVVEQPELLKEEK